uniref:Uncharacterized protein n=1 Tax=Timema poppense TaxID=170557 RepID=A0A7R9DAD3_TIMPO|nr:unnamed protein product [Timema poppensis]
MDMNHSGASTSGKSDTESPSDKLCTRRSSILKKRFSTCLEIGDGSDNTNKHVNNASTKSGEPHHQDNNESSVELEGTPTISVKEYMKKLNNELVSWSQLGAERRTNKKKAKLDLATSTLELNLANCHEFLTDDDKRSISMTVDCRDILKTYEDMKDMAAVNAHLKHKMKHRTKCLLDRVDAAIAVTKADICHKDDPD